MAPDRSRAGYLTIDALVALGVTAVAVTASVALAATCVSVMARANDRLVAARIADGLYQDLYVGRRAEEAASGQEEGRAWSYEVVNASDDEGPSVARRATIKVQRRMHADLAFEAILPPAPATASSN